MGQGDDERNKQLDLLKSFACLLMVLAHARLFGRTTDDSVTILLWKLGFFAPVVFMGAMGWGLAYQMQKRSRRELILFYCALLAVTLPYFGSRGTYPVFYGGLFFWLALAAITCVLFPRITTRWWVLILPFCMIDVARFIYHAGVPPTQFSFHVFYAFRWMYFVLLGRYLAKHPRLVVPFLVVSVVAAVAQILAGARLPGQALTPLFFTIGTAVYCLALFAIAHANRLAELQFVGWLGRSTLAFLFVHRAFLATVPVRLPAPAEWLLVGCGLRIPRKPNTCSTQAEHPRSEATRLLF